MKDPLFSLFTNEVEADTAIDLAVQLEKGTGTRPVLWLLVRARDRAAAAMRDLIEIDPIHTTKIIILQQQVAAYADLMADCAAMLSRGKEADKRIDEHIREEIADTLDVEEAMALGIQQTPEDM